jgi:hypothetical protein
MASAQNPFPAGSIEAVVFAVGTEAEQVSRLEAYWKSPKYAEDMIRWREAEAEGARRTAAGEQMWQQPNFEADMRQWRTDQAAQQKELTRRIAAGETV